MKVDFVITTYNRDAQLVQLVEQVIKCRKNDITLIIVDSSDEVKNNLHELNCVTYVKSSHKNQPYQRYLGYLTSKADIIIFLDDDMEIIDCRFIDLAFDTFRNIEVSGIAFNFTDKHCINNLDKIPKSKLSNTNFAMRNFIGAITGYPLMGVGKLGLCGNKGKQPANGGKTEWVSGGAFAARRSMLFQDFNFRLFDLFEKRLGMGEDTIIGYNLSKVGELIYIPHLFFYHNDLHTRSFYSSNLFSYSRRVIFSRLFLSLEKCRLDKRNYLLAYLHFHWYSIWRSLGLILSFLISFRKERLSMLYGFLDGWLLTISFKFNKRTIEYWKNEAESNLKHI